MALDSNSRNGFTKAESGQKICCLHRYALLISQKEEDEVSLSKYM